MSTSTSHPDSENVEAEGIIEEPSSMRPSPSLRDELEMLPPVRPQHTIYKVHRELRNIKDEAYEPLLIAIGPYHNHNENLKKMKSHKLHYLNSFLKREKKTIHDCMLVVKRRESKARECYAESINLGQAEFIEMLVLDGCFIVEFALRCRYRYLRETNDPLFKMDWMSNSIASDLLLFENQIPFFILHDLFNLIDRENKYSEHKNADLTFLLLEVYENFCPLKLGSGHVKSSTKHLLELIHRSLVFVEEGSVETSTRTDQTEASHKCNFIRRKGQDFVSSMTRLGESVKHMLKLRHRSIYANKDFKGATRHIQPKVSSEKRHDPISSATSLLDCNVKFKSAGNITFFRIEFENGCLRLPCLKVEDKTESFFRNLIAYEQYFLESTECRHVTDYVTFMDCLINTAQDVKLLVNWDIIENWVGSEEAIVEIFNNLTNGVVSVFSDKFIYKLQFEEVNKHRRLPINAWMAKLKQNHLSSPWTIIPIIAAFVLLALTVTQTVFAIIK